MLQRVWIAIFGSMLIFSCGDRQDSDTTTYSDKEKPIFELLDAKKTGVDFSNDLLDDPLSDRNVLSWPHYYNGGGVAIGDINNDGLPDIFLISNEGPNRLFLNKGDFEFEDITESSGINDCNKQWSSGAVMVDINGNGYLDIYVLQAGYGILEREDRENLLLINNGDNTFTERAAEFGLNDANESVSAVFFDYNNNGLLDVYVLNESEYAFMVFQKVFDSLKDKENLRNASGNLFRNNGDGTFTNVTEEAGLLRYGFGLGVVAADINGDGYVDLYVTNDYSVPDFLWINNGDGTFTDKINEMTRNISFFAMGADVADFNNDGFLDIAVVDMAMDDHIRDKTLMESMDVEGFFYFVNTLGYQYQYMFNSLQLNNGNNTFSNIAGMAGLLRTEWSWAAIFADFNNNGWKDFFTSNGFRKFARDNDFRIAMERVRKQHGGSVPMEMREDLFSLMPEVKTMNVMFENNKDLTFSKVSEEWGLSQLNYSYGAAFADLNGDGDLDLVTNNVDQPVSIYRNRTSEKGLGNYLQLELKGETPQQLVYNSKVTLRHGDQLQYQDFHPVRGYASSMEPILHFGLGDIQTVDELEIIWPNKTVTRLNNIEANQRLTLTPRDAVKYVEEEKEMDLPFVELDPQSIGIDFVHTENEYYDFGVEILLPHKQSTLGPKIAVGDVNGNGLDDFYIGGAANQNGALYLQNEGGGFTRFTNEALNLDPNSEEMGVHFFDADNNGNLDLYIVGGGGGDMPVNSPLLQDRFFINTDGKGNFSKVNALPEMFSSGQVVRTADIDGDGIPEIFIGGAAVPATYPYPERSYILKLQGNRYVDITGEIAPELSKPGMVKDAVFTDLNNNGQMDLIVVGEWMPVMIFINEGGTFRDASEEYGTADLKGWWYSVAVEDLNGNGNKDIILGNVGLNTKFKASKKEPFHVFADDFDDDGKVDIVLSKYYKGKLVPSRGRECSSEQMPFILSKFPTYEDYATASLMDVYGEDNIQEALHLQVNTFASAVLLNRGGHFEHRKLPNLAQISPINQIIVEDVNNDGIPDLIIAGNMYNTEVETPRYDAGSGLVLIGNGEGDFEPKTVIETGFFAPHNVKDLAILRNTASGKPLILVSNNDDRLQVFKMENSIEFKN
nr:VCBS repeat-containing protein [Saprospiraceae bacterium]